MNSSFPKIFVISLKDASERRQPLIDALDRMGVTCEMHWAIDGRDGLPPECEALVDRDRTGQSIGRALSDAEYACALSHISVYRTMLAEGIGDAVVLEDDARLLYGFYEAIQKDMPDWADLVLFDHQGCFVRRLGSRPFVPGVMAHRICHKRPTLATGYRLTLATAERMKKASLPVHQPPDWPSDILDFRTFASWPRIVGHHNFEEGHSHLRAGRAQMIQKSRIGAARANNNERLLTIDYWRRKLTVRKLS